MKTTEIPRHYPRTLLWIAAVTTGSFVLQIVQQVKGVN